MSGSVALNRGSPPGRGKGWVIKKMLGSEENVVKENF